MQELKPCPFCGGEAKKIEGLFAYIYCENCGVQGPKYLHMDEAVKHWNKRVEGDSKKSKKEE